MRSHNGLPPSALSPPVSIPTATDPSAPIPPVFSRPAPSTVRPSPRIGRGLATVPRTTPARCGPDTLYRPKPLIECP
jgi:hypothetical protein